MGERVGRGAGPYLRMAGVERIAVLRALHLGDFLCSVPALRALKERFPGAEITLIGLRWARAVIHRYPYVDRFLEFPGYEGLEGIPWEPGRTEAFLENARAHRYDLAIQLHGDGRVSNGFVARLGARASLGYSPDGGNPVRQLDLELAWVDGEHEIARWVRLIEILGAEGRPDLEFPLTLEDRVEMERVARGEGIDLVKPMVGIHPGAKQPAKRWPEESFARVADHLAARLGAQVVISGTEEEIPVARRVASSMRYRPFLLAGKTSLGALAALMARMALVVTNDTGPSHLAAAVGAPSVVLFGPTDPARWAPPDGRIHRALWSGQGNPISCIPTELVLAESLRLVERWAYPMS